MSTIADGGVGRTRAGSRTRTREAAANAKPKQTPKQAPRTRTPFGGGVLWIVVIGALLAGIVAVNVVVLQLNMRFDDLGRERAQLQADNALLRSQLSSASANVRIEDAATRKLGLQPADPLTTTYVQLAAK